MWQMAGYYDESDDFQRGYAVAGLLGHQHDLVHLDLAWREIRIAEQCLELLGRKHLFSAHTPTNSRLQTMMTLACCLGLRPSEFLGLQWQDLDASRGVLMVSRSITGLHIEGTKTPDSEVEIVLDPDVLALLLRWREDCPDCKEKWLFPNPDTGRPFHSDSLRDDHLHPAGQTIGISNLGWYAFRHTYRTLLDDLGTPIGVQQKLMRHSDVRTTMNHYGSAYEKTKRRANMLVAGQLLPESMKAASRTMLQ